MNALAMKRTGACLLRKRQIGRCGCGMGRAVNNNINNNSANAAITRRQVRSFSSRGPKSNGKKPKMKFSAPGASSKSSSSSAQSTWCTSATAAAAGSKRNKSLEMGRYGLKRLDYTNMKPQVWTAPPHPPTKTVAERVVFPFTLALVSGIVLWVYMTPEEDDMTEYWKRVESGQILLDDDYDDDDDYEDDDDEE